MREKRPVVYSFLFLICAMVSFLLVSVIVGIVYASIPSLEDAPVYLIQVIVDLLFFLMAYIYLKKTGYIRFLSERKTGIFKGLWVGGYFLFVGVVNLIIQIGYIDGKEILPVEDIMIFVLAMFFIGLAEETVLRGILSNVLFESFKGSASGVKLSVLLSGIFFGLFHLVNAVGGEIKLSGVIVQVLVTSAMGMLFTAIYYRTRNLWVVITLHALIDLAALFSTGTVATTTIGSVIDDYTVTNIASVIPFIVATLFLLRKSKMKEIIEPEDTLEGNDISVDTEYYTETVATIEKKEPKDCTFAVKMVSFCYVLVIIAGVVMLSID